MGHIQAFSPTNPSVKGSSWENKSSPLRAFSPLRVHSARDATLTLIRSRPEPAWLKAEFPDQQWHHPQRTGPRPGGWFGEPGTTGHLGAVLASVESNEYVGNLLMGKNWLFNSNPRNFTLYTWPPTWNWLGTSTYWCHGPPVKRMEGIGRVAATR